MWFYLRLPVQRNKKKEETISIRIEAKGYIVNKLLMLRKQSQHEGGEHTGREQAVVRGNIYSAACWKEKKKVRSVGWPRDSLSTRSFDWWLKYEIAWPCIPDTSSKDNLQEKSDAKASKGHLLINSDKLRLQE